GPQDDQLNTETDKNRDVITTGASERNMNIFIYRQREAAQPTLAMGTNQRKRAILRREWLFM
ncbi:MAG: hypothetical protein PUF63_00940, partial [Prevotella sp.]|nr:hypothetical protein [Prevotella sp.]